MLKPQVKLSIIVPGIRPHLWKKLCDSIPPAFSQSWEVIFVGPLPLPDEFKHIVNIRYVKDYGNPSRCLMIGAELAMGQYITWASDDGVYAPDSLNKCLQQLEEDPVQSFVGVRYFEGVGGYWSEFPMHYWNASWHADLRKPGVSNGWLQCGFLFMPLGLFLGYGGIDCKFEHINMNIHDLAFRLQSAGHPMKLSPVTCMAFDFDPHRDPNTDPVLQAFFQNDQALFSELYKDDARLKAPWDMLNWRESPVVWARRFKAQ